MHTVNNTPSAAIHTPQPPASVEHESSCLGTVGRATARVAAGTFAMLAAGATIEVIKNATPGGAAAAGVLAIAAGTFQMLSYIGTPVEGWMD